MASKQAKSQAQAPQAPDPAPDTGLGTLELDVSLPDLGEIPELGASVGVPPTEPPAPPDQDDDEDDDDRDQPSQPPVEPARTSRRGFLGAAAAVVGGAAAAAAMPPPIAEAAPSAAPAAGGMTPEMAAMADFFTKLMNDRDDRLLAELDRRVSAIRSELPVPNGVAQAAPAELAARPGQYPPSMTYPQPVPVQQAPVGPWPSTPTTVLQQQQEQTSLRQRRMVAFIPKEDPYNPRQTTFRTWVNGRELRSKRGQVMILSLGHGVDLAKNGHGNCVDIAAMQGVGVAEPLNVRPNPDYSRPSDWDGLPMTARSSIPIGRAS